MIFPIGIISGASILEVFAGPFGQELAAHSLNERSVNLDAALQSPAKTRLARKLFVSVNASLTTGKRP
jgi:hypothetical protein